MRVDVQVERPCRECAEPTDASDRLCLGCALGEAPGSPERFKRQFGGAMDALKARIRLAREACS